MALEPADTLLSLEQIEQGLAEKYAEDVREFPEHFAGMIPKRALQIPAEAELKILSKFVGSRLPISFETMYKTWDFNNLRIAGTDFSWRGDYVQQFLAYNDAPPGMRWWEDRDTEFRPNDFVMIAQGDPFITLLQLSTGEIYAYATDDGSEHCKMVALDIELYIRALGTIGLMVEKTSALDDFANQIVSALGANVASEFWSELIICGGGV
jgi:hypothetical protein